MSAKGSTKSAISKSMNPGKWTALDWFIAIVVLAGIICLILWLAGVFDSDDIPGSTPGTVVTTTPTPTPSSRISGIHF